MTKAENSSDYHDFLKQLENLKQLHDDFNDFVWMKVENIPLDSFFFKKSAGISEVANETTVALEAPKGLGKGSHKNQGTDTKNSTMLSLT